MASDFFLMNKGASHFKRQGNIQQFFLCMIKKQSYNKNKPRSGDKCYAQKVIISSTSCLIFFSPEEPQKRKSIPQSLDKLKKEDVAIFSIASHSAKQLRHFKYATVHLLVSLFSGQDFMVQVC